VPALSSLVAEYKRRLLFVAQRATEITATRVYVRTPVDSGALRASWTPSLDGAYRLASSAGDATPLAPVIARLTLGAVFTLRNRQPYGPAIEYHGHSGQAPAGMLGPSIAEWGANVREATRAAR